MNETALRQPEENKEMAVDSKKPYETPRVIYRAPLEAMAALCGTSQPPGKTSLPCTTTFS